MRQVANDLAPSVTTLSIVKGADDGLAELIDQHVPADTDPNYTDFYRRQWLSALPKARRVVVRWVEDYGWKLRASWLGSDGTELISLGRPQKRAESLRDFVRNWQAYMEKQGITVRVDWDDHLNGDKPRSRVAS
jgi:hypothetical protein